MKRVSDQIADAIEKGLEEVAPGEEIAWDLTLLPPTEQMQNAYLVSLTAASAILGQLICLSFILQAGFPVDPEGVKDALRQGVEQVRSQRSASIQPPGANGNGKGLIVP